MRLKSDPQRYFDWSVASRSKVVRAYENKYNWVSDILDANPGLLALVHKDLRPLSRDGRGKRRGRKADFTTEHILRALVVYEIEGTSLRETVVRIAHSPFLQNFLRLGVRRVMDFTFLDKCFKAMEPKTWRQLNDALRTYAIQEEILDPSKLRVDTTVVEANIHWPTDSSLLWDSWRSLCRLLDQARKACPYVIETRFHARKVKKLHLTITRYITSPSKKRQRNVKKAKRKLLAQVARIAQAAEGFVKAWGRGTDLVLSAIAQEVATFLPRIRQVLTVAERAWLQGEEVPARERIFSIFEDHVELIKRGRRQKPVEFGHMVLLGQSREKFITQYDVMEKRVPDCDLTDQVIEEHKAAFGSPPDELSADKGFRPKPEVMEVLQRKVKFVAIPHRLKDWADEALVAAQNFRAGIEGSISVLKRAFGLLRCRFRSYRSFEAFVGLGVFCHNLVNLALGP